MAAGESYYRFETADGCLIATLLPELNDKQWADIEKVGSELVDRLSSAQSPKFIVDLTPLSYMGSAMVALIVRLYKTVNGRGGHMVVVNQHELVFEVLKLAGLTKLWTIVENRDKAFAALGVRRRSTATAGSPSEGGNGLLLAGIIGTVGAILGLGLQFSSHPVVPRKVAVLIEFVCAAVGMVVGTMILVNQTGTRRNVGIALLSICLLAVLGGIVFSPEPSAAVAPPAANGTSSSTSPASSNPASAATTVAETKAATTNTATSAPAAKDAAPTASATPTQSAPASNIANIGKRKDK